MVTPAFIRDAAKAAFDEGLTFYIPNMRGYRAAERGAVRNTRRACTASPFPISRTTVTPSGMQALYTGAGAPGRCRHQRRLRRAAMAQHPQRHPSDRRRAAPLRARFRRRLEARSRPAVLHLRRAHRAIFLSTPSNPTGWTATRAGDGGAAGFSRRTGIWIISDEVYSRLYFDGERGALHPAGRRGRRPRACRSTASPRRWAMTGWRARLADASRPASADQLGAMTQYINSGTAGPIQAGANAAIPQGEPLVQEIRAAHQDRPRPRL